MVLTSLDAKRDGDSGKGLLSFERHGDAFKCIPLPEHDRMQEMLIDTRADAMAR
jgi:hypothetical protein